jgi:hypothetical protein
MGWFFVAGLGRLPEAAAAAWLPLVLELSWRILRSRQRRRSTPLLGLVLAISFATGGTTTAWLATGLGLAVFLSGLNMVDREARSAGLREALTAGAIAVLCSAPAWLDLLQLGGDVRFGDLSVDNRRLQIEGLAGALAPGAFQRLDGTGPMQLEMINPGADPLELALYPGAIVLFAALLGLFRPKRTLRSLFWLVTMAVGVMLTLDGPIGSLLAQISVAPMSPGAALVLTHVGAIVLACTALDNFFDAPIARSFGIPLSSGIAGSIAAVTLFAIFVAPSVLFDPALRALERDPWDGPTTEALAHAGWHLLPFALTTLLIALGFPYWRRLGILRFKWMLGTVALAELVLVGLWLVPRAPFDDVVHPVDDLVARLPASRGRVLAAGPGSLPSPARLAAEGSSVVDTSSPRILERTASLLELVDPSLVRGGRRPSLGRLAIGAQFDDPLLAVAAVDIAISRQPIVAETFVPLAATPPAGDLAAALDEDRVHVALRADPATSQRARLYFDAIPVADAEEAAAVPGRVPCAAPPDQAVRQPRAFACRDSGWPLSGPKSWRHDSTWPIRRQHGIQPASWAGLSLSPLKRGRTRFRYAM